MKLALLVTASVILSAACVADVPDDPVGSAEEPGIHYGTSSRLAVAAFNAWLASHPGPCAHACLSVLSGACSTWKETCHVIDWVNCGVPGGTTLACYEAASAAKGWPEGVDDCYRSCAGGDE